MLKVSKQSVNYSGVIAMQHCGHAFEGDKNHCGHFIEPPTGAADLGACEKVSDAISRVYWCRLWARARLS